MATYYVTKNGSDSDDGLSISTPWLTIQKAANTMTAGDTVFVEAGTYVERVQPVNSGTAGNYIVYRPYDNEVVIIDGTGLTFDGDFKDGLFDLATISFTKIIGFELHTSTECGIALDLTCSFVEILDNHVHSCENAGILVDRSNNIIIDGNYVHDVGSDAGRSQEMISLIRTSNFVISNNEVHTNASTDPGEVLGIDAKDGVSKGKIFGNHVHDLTNVVGIYVDAADEDSTDIEVYNNLVHDIVSVSGMAVASEVGGDIDNIRVHHNIIYNIGDVGLYLAHHATATVDSIYFENNTIYNTGYDGAGVFRSGILQTNLNATNVYIRNNIVRSATAGSIVLWRPGTGATSATVSNNLIDTYGGNQGETVGDNAIQSDPLFVNEASNNFHLNPGSPAIDQGISLSSYKFDHASFWRAPGETYDVGALEHMGIKKRGGPNELRWPR